MDAKFEKLLFIWEKSYITDQDLMLVFFKEDSRRYDAVKYALKKGILKSVRRGLYLIGPPYKKVGFDAFEIAQKIYGPSYISFESALSYHGWIPEAVYTTTSATAKKGKIFKTSVGVFYYLHIPAENFYLNVQRVSSKESIFFVAEPWKALADYMYSHRKKWKTIHDLFLDLRIEKETMEESDLASLEHVANYYPKKGIRNMLSHYLKELM